MDIVNKKFLVLGAFGKSGMAVCKLIKTLGGIVYFFDDVINEEKENELKKLGCRSCFTFEIQVEFYKKLCAVIVAPSVSNENVVVRKAKSLNIPVLSEMEFSFNFVKGKIIAVTGTNGKSTTVTMINNILKIAGKKTFLLGNIGVPLAEKCLDTSVDSFVCLEVSSYQLENIRNFKPFISVILNLKTDHIERHKSFENYVLAKKNIYKNQTESEYLILNFDDKLVKKCKSKAQKIYFSLFKRTNGAYLKGNKIYYNDTCIINKNEMKILGMHNVQNALASISALKLLGINDYYIKQGLIGFNGLKYRIEKIRTVDGITFINDSKATNIHSTLTALASITRPLVLILGGYDKNEDFDNLIPKLKKNVKHIIVLGENKYKIINSLIKNSFLNYTVVNNLKEAVLVSFNVSKYYEIVLFSPASASFDMFENFEKRGEAFNNLVNSL